MKNMLSNLTEVMKTVIFSINLTLYINNQPVRIPVGPIIAKIAQSEKGRTFFF